MQKSDRAIDAQLRRAATSLGLSLKKSRASLGSVDNHGGYRIVHARTNAIECGERFDMAIEEVAKYLAKNAREEKLTALANSLERLISQENPKQK